MKLLTQNLSIFIALFLLNFDLHVFTSVIQKNEIKIHVNASEVIGVKNVFNGKEFWSFRGIRYGEKPTGHKRFHKVNGIELPRFVNATQFGAHCFPVFNDSLADEDCLFLNVYCPPFNGSQNLKAVMFFIHGGGNIYGNVDDKDGSYLTADNDVILVTFNYRLGPFGFFSTEDMHAPGNAALWDQNLALKWVKRYISFFGGDNRRITVFGVSAGAKSAAAHAVSPHSKHLFSRVFCESGTIFSPSMYLRNAQATAKHLAERVNCSSNSNGEMIRCLQKLPAVDLAVAGGRMWSDDPVKYVTDFGWGAVKDNNFLPNNYTSSSFEGEVMLGLNNNEGEIMFRRLDDLLSKLPDVKKWFSGVKNFKEVVIPKYLQQYFNKTPTGLAIEATVNEYLSNCSSYTSVQWRNVLSLHADQQYVVSAVRFLKEKISSNTSYLYYFDYNVPQYNKLPLFLRGSHHAGDSEYVFGLKPHAHGYNTSILHREMNMSSIIRAYVTNFAKTGNPNYPEKTAVAFPSYDTDLKRYLDVNLNLLKTPVNQTEVLKSKLLEQRMNLWLLQLPRLMEQKSHVLIKNKNTSSLTKEEM